jgi:branched-chain amino acid transport system substrate-binding protein
MAGASVTSDRAAVDHWLKDDPKIHSAVILYDSKDAVSSSEATGVFPSVLKANGIKILDSISFQTGDIDFSAQVTRAKGLAPDGVVVAALYNEASHLMREMRSQGMQQPVAAGIGILDPRFIQLAGPSAEGVVVGTDYFSGIKSAANEMFVVEVDKQVHAPPSNAAALIYDTLYLVRNCIIKQNVMGDDVAADRRKIQQCVSTTKDEKTPLLLGATSFNADGESIRKPNVLIVKGGDFVLAP